MDPTDDIGIAYRAGFSELLICGESVTSEAGEWTHLIIAAVSELIESTGTIQHV